LDLKLPKLPVDVVGLIGRLESAGFMTWVVGGSVRDFLIGVKPKDWDLATTALPVQISEVLKEFKVIPTGRAFGTMTVVTDKRPVQVTTLRAESGYSDSRHPDQIQFQEDICTDLSRRDFTINAIAYRPAEGFGAGDVGDAVGAGDVCYPALSSDPRDPGSPARFALAGGLVDCFGGIQDLQAGLLRAVGAADERLKEDPLRILRALRFVSGLGCRVDELLEASLHENRYLLKSVSGERVQVELANILAGQHVVKVLRGYADVLAVLVPEIGLSDGFDQKSPWHCYDVWEHTIRAIDFASTDDPLVRLALLFHDLGKPASYTIDSTGRGHFKGHADVSTRIADKRLRELRYDRHSIKTITELIQLHMSSLKPEHALIWLHDIGCEQLYRLIELKRGDMAAHAPDIASERIASLDEFLAEVKRLVASGACYSLEQLEIDGSDLRDLGFEQGMQIGEVLQSLLHSVIFGELCNNRDDLLTAATTLMVEAAKWEDRQ
jgi:tRNA nucleotidyltransferase (CCA-adding enzyme)